jgi:hypothetical protein
MLAPVQLSMLLPFITQPPSPPSDSVTIDGATVTLDNCGLFNIVGSSGTLYKRATTGDHSGFTGTVAQDD